MVKELELVAIIPARGGSKRIPNKNIIGLAGKPLIAYTIEASLKSHLRTIVSTDSKKIASISRKYGAEVMMRDKSLAQDDTPTEDVLIDILKKLRRKVDYIILLQPTSPLRDEKDIMNSIELLMLGFDSVVSVTRVPNSHLMGHFKGEGYYDYKPEFKNRLFSNNAQKKYRENGAIYITRINTLLKYKNRLGGKVGAFVMDELKSVDIDDKEDLNMVEKIMRFYGR